MGDLIMIEKMRFPTQGGLGGTRPEPASEILPRTRKHLCTSAPTKNTIISFPSRGKFFFHFGVEKKINSIAEKKYSIVLLANDGIAECTRLKKQNQKM